MADIHETKRILREEADKLKTAGRTLDRREAYRPDPVSRLDKVAEMISALFLEMRYLQKGAEADRTAVSDVATGLEGSKERMGGAASLSEMYGVLLDSARSVDTGYAEASERYAKLGTLVSELDAEFTEARGVHDNALQGERTLRLYGMPPLAGDMEAAAARL